MIVIDASVALAWSFHDERTEAVLEISRQVADNGACVPVIWHYEVANTFRMAVRKGRITTDLRQELMDSLNMLPIEIDVAGSDHIPTVNALADRFDLTVYDAAYLDLALRRELTLATLDNELAAAARAAGVAMLP